MTTNRAIAVARTLDEMARTDRGRLLSLLIGQLRDFQLAEDVLQEAFASAAVHWGRNGLPQSPQGWLLTAARRKAIDRVRQRKVEARVADEIAALAGDDDHPADDAFADERLRLIFTCCHPALEQKSQIALTLRVITGLTTGEIAQAFLDQEATMGQRLSRAKAKIAAAGIPYAVPDPEAWPERLNAVLGVIYLVFNAGYTQACGRARDLREEAIYLACLLARLKPGEPEIEGCLALLLLSHARRDARIDAAGVSVPIEMQDRQLWHRGEIAEGLALVERALGRGAPRPFQIKAAIAACHCEGEHSDWRQIAALYDVLMQFEPTPVVRLNRAVAYAETGELAFALREIEAIAPNTGGYQPFWAARAALLVRHGRLTDAMAAYDAALALTEVEADRRFLLNRKAVAASMRAEELNLPEHADRVEADNHERH